MDGKEKESKWVRSDLSVEAHRRLRVLKGAQGIRNLGSTVDWMLLHPREATQVIEKLVEK